MRQPVDNPPMLIIPLRNVKRPRPAPFVGGRAAGLGSEQVLINALADSDEGLADLVKRVASRNDSQDGMAFFYPRALGREVCR